MTKRKAFFPTRWSGAYRLPPSIHERLTAALSSFRNRDAAHRLAVWLARMNASPTHLGRAFPIDRRALCGLEELGLSEAKLRGAIATLIRVGFLKVIGDGAVVYLRDERGVRRKPLQYQFDGTYREIFILVARRKSPKDRQESNLIRIPESREALPLGELRLSTGGRRTDRRATLPTKAFNRSDFVEEGLGAALHRLMVARALRQAATQ